MQEEKTDIVKHIFHLEESYPNKYKDPEDLMVILQESLDRIAKYKEHTDDHIGELDLQVKLFPSILRPNLNRITAEPPEVSGKLINYVARHLEKVGEHINSLYGDVKHDYKQQVLEIGQLMKTLDPEGTVIKEAGVNLNIFLKA
ncbi:MAG TPA: hypothetical protein DCE41_34700 [Cytophagales bacterium]|nr:hypothetical protein [Cytophagales bacterium]